MRGEALIFVAASLVLLTLSRLALAAWQWPRVRDAGGLWPLLRGGVRIDAHMIGVLAAWPLVLGPWLGEYQWAADITAGWFILCWILLALLEVSTPPFIQEYDTRPNRLFVEYLKHPREVSNMVWRGYKTALLGGTAVLVLASVAGCVLFVNPTADPALLWWQQILYSVVMLALVILAIRGTLGHRPINPSSVAYCSDGMVNTLALNSLYNVVYAIYSMKNERGGSSMYGKMPSAAFNELVMQQAGLPWPPADAELPSLHRQAPVQRASRPKKLVIILEESLGAQYSAALGGMGLTPELDALMAQGWAFTRAYATGTRSVRGLEAVTTGFPPTPMQAVLKLPRAQRGFFTIAEMLGRQGYHSRFIYGGESHFDNMKAFFLGNGFDRIVDRSDFTDPAFCGTWGASDEDMFAQLDRLLREDADEPTFTLAFSVSNHTPWEYPAGRIEVDGNPATEHNSVRYADWALGRFFEQAREAPYWNDTVFLVVADHDSRVFGATLVPVRHFHIPALILGGDIAPRRDDRIISQIDLPPTLLSLIGVEGEHPMIGHDLASSSPDRAIMQYDNTYGYLRGDDLLVMTPNRPPVQFRYAAPEQYTPVDLDAALARVALAHALWPDWCYREGRYRLASTAPSV
ncbi:LTA synthase family protein [Bordetella genomosp. 5]|uniref:Sulfatase n=1 Tax=Bordetella genomosp. 5 TaxID=1395608 RepID=A0A261U2T3_9BORD|nr:LTA synthase family protein [Bordetella genomosp. 5]OZI55560.1 sulfatase [Bordetella genomosp. 5]